jgi:hypothetical protein
LRLQRGNQACARLWRPAWATHTGAKGVGSTLTQRGASTTSVASTRQPAHAPAGTSTCPARTPCLPPPATQTWWPCTRWPSWRQGRPCGVASTWPRSSRRVGPRCFLTCGLDCCLGLAPLIPPGGAALLLVGLWPRLLPWPGPAHPAGWGRAAFSWPVASLAALACPRSSRRVGPRCIDLWPLAVLAWPCLALGVALSGPGWIGGRAFCRAAGVQGWQGDGLRACVHRRQADRGNPKPCTAASMPLSPQTARPCAPQARRRCPRRTLWPPRPSGPTWRQWAPTRAWPS